jgi:hypothetical protein
MRRLLFALACFGLAPLAACQGADQGLDSNDTDTSGDADGDSDGDAGLPPTGDADGDGLSNEFEQSTTGTDPNDADSDDDGVSDLVEWVAGTDPNDPASNPEAQGNFYFLVPYNEPPSPGEDSLVFATNIQMADVFFLLDTTGSMQDELNNLKASLTTATTGIIPQIQSIIPDTWFGVGHHDDYAFGGIPYGYGSGADLPFELHQSMTADAAAAQTAVNGLVIHSGMDNPESQVPALWAIATGGALEGFTPAQTSCPAGTIGYPCFRPGAEPIIVLITDAQFHNGPEGTHAYEGIDPAPPTYTEAVDALVGIHAKVLGIDSSGYTSGESYANLQQIAIDTGAVSSTGPLTIAIDTDGSGLGDNVVDAVQELAANVPLQISAAGRDDTADDVDATAFIDKIVANTAGGVEDPENPGVFCVSGLDTGDANSDGDPDEFLAVLPGTPVCFDIYPAWNTTVPPTGLPAVYQAFVDVVGDGVTVLDTRTIFFLVPPSVPVG